MGQVVLHLSDFPRTGRHQSSRWAAAALVTVCMSTILVMVPTPRVVSAHDTEVRTVHLHLGPRTADRSGDTIGTAMAAGDHGPVLRAALTATGRRSAPPVMARFHAIGVTVPVTPRDPILVRGRVAGTWTPWLELDFAPGEAPDLGTEGVSRSGPVHSESVWLGNADAYEIDAPADVADLDVHLVGDGPNRRSVVVSSAAAGATAAPSIQPRSAWSARAPKVHPTTTGDLKLAIVHHSVNSNTYTSADVPGLLQSIQTYHMDVQGWDDIAYNFAIDRFGQIWEARDGGTTKIVLGGHSMGFNTGTVGVVVLGDFTTAAVPAAAVESVAQLVAWKFALHRVDPSSTVPYTSGGSYKYAAGVTVTLPRIVGHRDVQATECPGSTLYDDLATIRTRVAQLLPSYQDGLSPLLLNPDSTGDGLIDPIEYHPGTPADLTWQASASGLFTKVPTSVVGAYRPAVGDFDGDGRDDIFWHGTGSSSDWMWWSGPAGTTSQLMPVSGSYVPVVGDFDGNGVDDIFWYNTGLGADSVWYFKADRSYTAVAAVQDMSTAVPLVGDFNGDGKADIFFYGPGTADDTLWVSTGQGWKVSTQTVNGFYEPVVADATGDGIDDIIWFWSGSVTSYRWAFDATGAHTSINLSSTALVGTPHVGDFDGDGLEDVIVVASGDPADEVWYSTPTGIEAHAVSVRGTYEVRSGRMHSGEPATSDVLYVSTSGNDYLWQGLPNRTFLSTQVG